MDRRNLLVSLVGAFCGLFVKKSAVAREATEPDWEEILAAKLEFYDHCNPDQVIAYLESSKVEVSSLIPWISVLDELPLPCETCRDGHPVSDIIMASTDDGVYQAKLLGDARLLPEFTPDGIRKVCLFVYPDEMIIIPRVTHWARWPSPPMQASEICEKDSVSVKHLGREEIFGDDRFALHLKSKQAQAEHLAAVKDINKSIEKIHDVAKSVRHELIQMQTSSGG